MRQKENQVTMVTELTAKKAFKERKNHNMLSDTESSSKIRLEILILKLIACFRTFIAIMAYPVHLHRLFP